VAEPKSPAAAAVQTTERVLDEAVAVLQEHGKSLTLRQASRIVTSLRVALLLSIAGLLIALAGGAYKLGLSQVPQVVAPASASLSVQRSKPPNLLTYQGTFAHEDLQTWFIPLARYLDSPEYTVVKLETTPLPEPTESFRLLVEPNLTQHISGLAFLWRPDVSGPLLQPLKIVGDEVGQIRVPPSEKGDRILLVLRFMGDLSADQLNRVVSLRADI